MVQEGLIRLPLQPSRSGRFGREPLLNGGWEAVFILSCSRRSFSYL